MTTSSKNKSFFIDNYTVHVTKSKNGATFVTVKMSDIKKDFLVRIPLNYILKIAQAAEDKSVRPETANQKAL